VEIRQYESTLLPIDIHLTHQAKPRTINMHRLEQELYDLVEQDHKIFSFVEEACLDGMWYWDLESPEHEWMSPNFWLTLGYDPSGKEHLASEWQDIINQEDLTVAVDNFQKHCADANHPYDQIVRYKHKLGHTVWVRCVGLAIRDSNGKATRMLGAHTDLTELKQSEEKLKTTIELREKFFARMSHEIRTPLHGIIGLADVLKAQKNRLKSIPHAEFNSKIDIIASCGEQLLTLLDDLLTLGTMNEDKLHVIMEQVNLAPVAEYVVNLYRAKAETKGIEFILVFPDIMKGVIVETDKTRLTQIISNLVSNAIKFTNSGKVTIEFTDSSDNILIAIRDTGCGINDVSSVFNAYYREQHGAEETGSGLGLEIVQRLCSQLDHKITLTSTQGEGSEFTIELKKSKLTQSALVVANNDHADVCHSSFGKVLIVDDNEINQSILVSMLESNCQQLVLAKNGQEAIDIVYKDGEFDLILMDLHMPIKDGYTAAQEILNLPLPKPPRIIAVSADAYPETIERCKRSGMKQHLKKPFTKAKLLERLQ